MTRFLPAFQILCIGAALAAPSEPVALEDGLSPDKRYEVVLEADKDTPSFARYEFKGDASQYPKFLIRDTATGRIVGRQKWPGDSTAGDERMLRNHARVLWRADGGAVAINTDERFYSYTSVLARGPKDVEFICVSFPDYKTLTGFAMPNSDDLRPRGFASATEWNSQGLLVYHFESSPLPSYKGVDPLKHRVTLRVTERGMEVFSREALKNND